MIKKVKCKDLELGDIVSFGYKDGYAAATIIRKDGDIITAFRPYVHTSDVVYSGNRVISYIGHEQLDLNPESEMILLRRNPDTLR